MTRLFYTIACYLLLPFMVTRLWWLSRQNPAYRQRIHERFAYIPQRTSQQPCIWVHAVSVGETIAAQPLVEQLLQHYPSHELWLTTTTPTGLATLQRLYGTRLAYSYFPYDTPAIMRRMLQRLRPALVLIMETEIWPNLCAECHAQGIPLVLANARLSTRSFHRYQKVATLTRQTLQRMTWIGARSALDRDYFQQLGALPQQIAVCGNVKFDLHIPADLPQRALALKAQWGQTRLVVVAGSTHHSEDEIILQAYQFVRQYIPDLLLIIAPRHPERFASVTQLCQATGLAVVQRSQQTTLTPAMAILLGDSMGELLLWYAAADIAIIGGSFVPVGGHNPLEAAAFGVPIISGCHTHNFADVFPNLCAAGGATQITAPQLAQQLLTWLQNPDLRHHAGQAADAYCEQQQGAVQRLLQHLAPFISPPSQSPPQHE